LRLGKDHIEKTPEVATVKARTVFDTNIPRSYLRRKKKEKEKKKKNYTPVLGAAKSCGKDGWKKKVGGKLRTPPPRELKFYKQRAWGEALLSRRIP